MTESLSLLPTLMNVFTSLDVERFLSRETVERGFARMQATLLRASVEAFDAEVQGRGLTDAGNDDVAFPTLHRLHVGVRDILTMSLPPELSQWVAQLLAMPESPVADELQLGLGRLVAAEGIAPTTRALARVLLFQAVRTNLLIVEHLSGTSIAEVGAMADDVDRIAEAQVVRWIEQASARPLPGDTTAGPLDGIRPLEVLVAAALIRLDEHLDDLKNVLARLEGDLVTAYRVRAELELKLREMDASDAVLIRNAFAPALDEQRVEVERLRDHHEMVLGDRSRDALDQQVSRMRAKMKNGQWPTRKRPALIDLIADQEQEPEHEDE